MIPSLFLTVRRCKTCFVVFNILFFESYSSIITIVDGQNNTPRIELHNVVVELNIKNIK